MGRALMGSCSEECCAVRMALLWAGKEPLNCVCIDMGTPKPKAGASLPTSVEREGLPALSPSLRLSKLI